MPTFPPEISGDPQIEWDPPTADLLSTEPPERPDAFSDRRAGFEIRTRWRCERVVLFHCIDLSPATPVLSPLSPDGSGSWWPVTSWHLDHDDSTHLSKLRSVTRVGWRSRDESGTTVTDGIAMPPVTFAYAEAVVGSGSETLGTDRDRLPDEIDGSLWRFVDLDGEGLPGLFTEQGGAWYYKRNEGDPAERASGATRWVGPMSVLRTAPSVRMVDGAALADVDGDGRLEVLTRSGPMAGTWSRTDDGGWEPFRPFRALPTVNYDDPNLRMAILRAMVARISCTWRTRAWCGGHRSSSIRPRSASLTPTEAARPICSTSISTVPRSISTTLATRGRTA